ncbi:MAG: hypothetical protein GF384_00095, partial [Elusimicrobia bacterium]|nr:hypothetical protein [Elusimicrobiota bacterium]MBD3411497.1 hypothetical protein [Elusimicrobiota bacterium]
VNNEALSRYATVLLGKATKVEVDEDNKTDDYSPPWSGGQEVWKVQNIDIAVSVGDSVFKGSYFGTKTLYPDDLEVIGENFNLFLQYIPKAIVMSAENEFLGMAECIPNPEQMGEFEEKSDEEIIGSINAEDFQTLYFNIPYLSASDNAMVAIITPNYPPYIKRNVVIPSTLDVNMDTDVGTGAIITGAIYANNQPLAGAKLKFVGRLRDQSFISKEDGTYMIPGVAPGVYRLTVTAEGYAHEAAKVVVYNHQNQIQNFTMTACAGSISGTVYSQKFPYPLTVAGAEIVAYDDTRNGQNPEQEIALYEVITGNDGTYTIEPVIEGHTYKVALVVPGKAVQVYSPSPEVPAAAGSPVTGIDFTYKSKPPELGLVAIPHPNGTSLIMEGETPKKGIDVESATYNEGTEYSATNTAITGDDVEQIGDERWQFVLPDKTKNYFVRFTLSDGAQTSTVDFVYDPTHLASKQDNIDDDSVSGGEFLLSDQDTSGLYFSPGSITLGEGSIPQVTMEKIDVPDSSQAAYMDPSIIGGDVYQVDMSMDGSAQNDNKTMTLTIGYDPAEVGNNIDQLAMVQWNEQTQSWDPVLGAVMVDPMSNTISGEINSIAGAAASSSSLAPQRVARAKFNGKEYVLDKHAPITSDQSGIFMAVLSSRGQQYTGEDLWVYNVPNPFNLKSKTVSLNRAVGTGQITTTGTVIRFGVPASMGNDIDSKFRIYNIAGELVREINASQELTGGVDGGYYYYLEWDGKNKDGDSCASGVYFCVADVGHKKKVVKMALVK